MRTIHLLRTKKNGLEAKAEEQFDLETHKICKKIANIDNHFIFCSLAIQVLRRSQIPAEIN